jgi:hypothetical protein
MYAHIARTGIFLEIIKPTSEVNSDERTFLSSEILRSSSTPSREMPNILKREPILHP